MLSSEIKSGLEHNASNIAKVHIFCGKCMIELIPIKKFPKLCTDCGKNGREVLYRCPVCGSGKRRFEQDMTEEPICFTCI